MSSAEKVWNTVANGMTISYGTDGEVFVPGIEQMAVKACGFESGEIKLLTAIIIQAGRDRDEEYINGAKFERTCDLLRLDSTKIRNLFTAVWSNLDDNS